MDENLDFFLPLICMSFLMMMHSHLIENYWRSLIFIITIIIATHKYTQIAIIIYYNWDEVR